MYNSKEKTKASTKTQSLIEKTTKVRKSGLTFAAEAGTQRLREDVYKRQDKDTSGLLVVAKDDATHIGLSQQMAVHSVERAYQTVVYGGFAQDEGFVEANLGQRKY